ncbi:golgin subfamily A member 2-like protein [Aphelenchoides avenae]|nr:golgin subfamily A member 2-like protein [Aphelenchus avenae]
MNESDPRISHARDLKFKAKQRQTPEPHHAPPVGPSEELPAPSVVNLNESYVDDSNADQSSVASDFSRPSSICNDKSSTDRSIEHVTPNMAFGHPYSTTPDRGEVEQLRRQLQEKEQSLNDAISKLQSLHTHYAELHTAYNLVSQSSSKSTPAEYAQQISQLQTALAAAIDEKTGLQSELRACSSKLTSLESELQAQKDTHKHSGHGHVESEMKRLVGENKHLSETVKELSDQLEFQRKESSSLEARILVIQQDRHDTQARLKYLYAEKEQLENQVETLRNELNMKEIYIRQLTRHSATDAAQEQQVIQSLTDENKRLQTELVQRCAEADELRRQFNAGRGHLEQCLEEANRRIAGFEVELSEVQTSKREVEAAKCYLEEQLGHLRRAAEMRKQELSEQMSNASVMSAVKVDINEYEALRNSLNALETNYMVQSEKIDELSSLLGEKDSRIEALEHALLEARQESERLREREQHNMSMNLDVSRLSEQLQNERATVSRAVAQNLELKEQLGELQDKIVQVTNECFEKEDQRQSALAQLNRLQKSLEELQSSDQRPPATTTVSAVEPVQVSSRPTVVTSEMESQTDAVEVAGEAVPHDMHDHPRQEFVCQAQQTDEFLPSIQPPSNIIPTPLQAATSLPPSVHPEDHHDQERPLSAPASPLCTEDAPRDGSRPDAVPAVRNDDGCAYEERREEHDHSNNLYEALRDLEARLERALSENKDQKMTNERLQYWLAALESENESIGEYIALYRFQRGNIQKKIAEKDQFIAHMLAEKTSIQKKLAELQAVVMSFLTQRDAVTGQPQPTSAAVVDETSNGAERSADDHGSGDALNGPRSRPGSPSTLSSTGPADPLAKMARILSEIEAEQLSHPAAPPPRGLNGSPVEFDPQLHCSECSGAMETI